MGKALHHCLFLPNQGQVQGRLPPRLDHPQPITNHPQPPRGRRAPLPAQRLPVQLPFLRLRPLRLLLGFRREPSNNEEDAQGRATPALQTDSEGGGTQFAQKAT